MGQKAVRRLALLGVLGALGLASAGQAGAAECAGDECQSPAPAPEEVIPATAIVEGPANPPVRFPKSGAGTKKHQGKKHHPAKKHHTRRGKHTRRGGRR